MVAVGIKSRKHPNRFATNSEPNWVIPVMFRLGRFRLTTRPSLTGSPAVSKTMGIVVPADFCRQCRRSSHRGNYIDSATDQISRHPR